MDPAMPDDVPQAPQDPSQDSLDSVEEIHSVIVISDETDIQDNSATFNHIYFQQARLIHNLTVFQHLILH